MEKPIEPYGSPLTMKEEDVKACLDAGWTIDSGGHGWWPPIKSDRSGWK